MLISLRRNSVSAQIVHLVGVNAEVTIRPCEIAGGDLARFTALRWWLYGRRAKLLVLGVELVWCATIGDDQAIGREHLLGSQKALGISCQTQDKVHSHLLSA